MDYRSLVQQFNKIDSDISAFIEERTTKNILRGNDIVRDYVDALKNNEYSIKSFKAKIIHNELEHRRTTEEFNRLINDAYVKIDDVLEKSFQNYLDVLANSKFALNKTADMREYEITKRRNRQDILNRINSLSKEYHQELNQDKEDFAEKEEEFTESINIENRKLQIDLNKCKEKTVKNYSSDEADLLITDDKKNICKLKEAIKNIRIDGLNEEHELRLKSHLDIKEKKIDFLNLKREYLINSNQKRFDMKIKTADYQLQIKELEIQIERRSFDYDIEYKKHRFEKLRSDKYTLVSLSKLHNEFLYKNELNIYEEDKNVKFLIAFILLKFYQMLITICESSIFDPLIGLLEEFININKQNNENYSATVKKIREQLDENISLLNDALFDISMSNKTRVKKEDLQENVITSIERYYNNIISEVAMFNNELEKVFLHIIKKFSAKYKQTSGKDLFDYNDCLFMNTNYDKSDLSTLGYQAYDFNQEGSLQLDDYYNALKDKVENYVNLIEEDYQKEMRIISKTILLFESKIKNKVDEAKDNFNKLVDDNKMKLNKENKKVNREIDKKISKIENDYIKACRNEKKLTKKHMGFL